MAVQHNDLMVLPTPTQPDFNERQIAIIKSQIAAGASDDELAYFLEVARLTGLNPLQRQIYAIMRKTKVGDKYVDKMTIQTGIDGYRLMAARTGELAGINDPVFDVEDAVHPNKASVTVWRFVQGQRVPFTASVRWNEYKQTGKTQQGEEYFLGQWGKMPYLMLGKCAEALALRKAFPAELSGLYTAEEMSQADSESLPYVDPAPARPAATDARPVVTPHMAKDRARLAAEPTAARKHNPSALKARAYKLGIEAEGWGKLWTNYSGDLDKIHQYLTEEEAAQQAAAPTETTEFTYALEGLPVSGMN